MIATASTRFAKLQKPFAISPDCAAHILLATAFVGAGILVAPAGTIAWFMLRKAR